MFARPLSAAAVAVAAFAYVTPAAEACDQCGYDPCPCVVPVVVDPCCEPEKPSLKERIAARRLERIERRADRLRDRLAEDECCVPAYGTSLYGVPAYTSTSSYGYSSYNYSSYGHGSTFGGGPTYGHGGYPSYSYGY